MPPPVFRYDFLIEALGKIGIHHLGMLPNGHVRWGDAPLIEGKQYKGKSIPTAPLTQDANTKQQAMVLFDLWTVQAILNKFDKSTAEFVAVYFGGRGKSK